MENRKVIIVGAGIGGLSAAYWLALRKYEVEILEASDRPGGRMVILERKGDRVDVGAQFYHSNFTHAFGLMDAMNLTPTKRKISGNVQYALKDGSSCIFNPRSPYMKLLGFHGNMKLYRFILKYILFGRRFPYYKIAKSIPEYDDREVLDLFKSPSDGPLRDYFVNLICSGGSSALPEWMSLYHYIRLFRDYIYTDYVCLTRGVASLANELARNLPVQYESSVRQLVMEKGRVVGVQMEKDGSIRKAGHVIVAVTPPAAASLMPDELEEQRQFFKSILYAQLPMPIFFLDRPLNKNIWCYSSDPNLKRTFVFAIDQHAKIPEMSPGGKSILTGWTVYPTALELMNKSDDIVIKTARNDIELMIPGFSGFIEDATVFRHDFVNALYPPGSYGHVLDFKEKAEKLKGVSFVSSALCGTSMEAAMNSAEDAVKRVCRWGGVG